MSVIDFKKAECCNCYKCVRACPVKAIKIKDEQASIVEEMCIGCGNCLKVCPQDAKHVTSELDKVKCFLKAGCPVAVSIAPSYAGVYTADKVQKIPAALKSVGISRVEETSCAAYVIERHYDEFRKADNGKTYITTSCPAAVNLIAKYHNSLAGTLVPVMSPMNCHGKMIKECCGKDTKVCFIGPCVAKKMEAKQDGEIDAVLTFDELDRWFREEKIDFNALPEMGFDFNGYSLPDFPVAERKWGLSDNGLHKTHLKVDGIENCLDVIHLLESGQLTNAFINISLCGESCMSAPALERESEPSCIRLERIKKHIAHQKRELNPSDVLFQEHFFCKNGAKTDYRCFAVSHVLPCEKEIESALRQIGKYTKKDELNCGGCGYNSCREKAIAVLNGMAEPYMCLPFMRQKAEAVSSLIFDITPNPIIILDSNLEIDDINPSAQKLLDVSKDFAKGKHIKHFMDDSDICEVKTSCRDIIVRKEVLEKYQAIVLKTIKYIAKQNRILIILNDITELKKKEENIHNMELKTIELAQEVIDKQMRVAQEIASLLGETTAETKMTLTQLKKIVQKEAAGNDLTL